MNYMVISSLAAFVRRPSAAAALDGAYTSEFHPYVWVAVAASIALSTVILVRQKMANNTTFL